MPSTGREMAVIVQASYKYRPKNWLSAEFKMPMQVDVWLSNNNRVIQPSLWPRVGCCKWIIGV
ncbi:hypothetical protein DPMN_047124 [Dreissena polymorpha]|uniref:Uncharacterized protein n=1 Tax=Dreissena polymorpha TaxID=45954 RepID=A0A9D4DAV9_DREPO|nr:hypothetical protein DPMN_047124 [Dreissena polymorpha]